MLQKLRDIEIDENGNIFENDLLDRESEIKNLTPIILSFNDPLVLALDSPWGAGKTTFVKLWQAYLKKEKSVESIYFNAWETDYAEDPLIVLVSELNKWLKTNHPSVANSFLDKTRKVLPSIVKQTVIAGVKIATANAVNGDQFDRIVSDATGNITGDLIDNFNKQAESVEKFKEIIAETLEELPSEQKNLIIFIDELDRCRPTYAIELLERIKHLFSIERLVFVLSTDTTQLTHSICAVYGNGFDAKKYLQRFIDLDYTLKKPEQEEYIQSQLNKLGIKEEILNHYNFNALRDCLFFFAKRFDLKIRDINLLLTRIRLILYSLPYNNYLDAPLLISLLILRDKNKELYNQYIEKPSIANEVYEFLCQGFLPLQNDYNQDNDVIANIIGHLITTNFSNDAENKAFKHLLEPYDKGDNNTSSDNAICRAITSLKQIRINRNTNGKLLLKIAVERIELIQQINLPSP
jgi:Cdc6-like AAA superfamily ATPase